MAASRISSLPHGEETTDLLLVDTSVWIDHLRRSDPDLVAQLAGLRVLIHPFVIGEIALGSLRNRRAVLAEFERLPRIFTANERAVLDFVEKNALGGSGIGYVDAHLLASVAQTDGCRLWTRDRRLSAIAERLGLMA